MDWNKEPHLLGTGMTQTGVNSVTFAAWNTRRRVWHVVGCLGTVVIFHLWKDAHFVIPGRDALVGVVWLGAAALFVIDLVRITVPEQEKAVEQLPFYGAMLRRGERRRFNASTYMLFAAALMASFWRFGLLGDTALTGALSVLALADPAAAGARLLAGMRGSRHVRIWGLAAFTVAGSGALYLSGLVNGCPPGWAVLLAVPLATGWIEGYTGGFMLMIRPLVWLPLRLMPRRTRAWFMRVYPDDNLLVPLAVAAMVEVFQRIA